MSAGFLAFVAVPALAQQRDAPGVTASEIKIGQTMPYSGPASVSGANGVADVAFTKWVNDQGGINGRKLDLISLDDAYSPPKTLEQTRKLVEEEGVAFIYRSMGTAPNTAIAKYLNDRKIPSFSSAPPPPNGTIRRTGPTAWAARSAMRWKPAFTDATP